MSDRYSHSSVHGSLNGDRSWSPQYHDTVYEEASRRTSMRQEEEEEFDGHFSRKQVGDTDVNDNQQQLRTQTVPTSTNRHRHAPSGDLATHPNQPQHQQQKPKFYLIHSPTREQQQYNYEEYEPDTQMRSTRRRERIHTERHQHDDYDHPQSAHHSSSRPYQPHPYFDHSAVQPYPSTSLNHDWYYSTPIDSLAQSQGRDADLIGRRFPRSVRLLDQNERPAYENVDGRDEDKESLGTEEQQPSEEYRQPEVEEHFYSSRPQPQPPHQRLRPASAAPFRSSNSDERTLPSAPSLHSSSSYSKQLPSGAVRSTPYRLRPASARVTSHRDEVNGDTIYTIYPSPKQAFPVERQASQKRSHQSSHQEPTKSSRKKLTSTKGHHRHHSKHQHRHSSRDRPDSRNGSVSPSESSSPRRRRRHLENTSPSQSLHSDRRERPRVRSERYEEDSPQHQRHSSRSHMPKERHHPSERTITSRDSSTHSTSRRTSPSHSHSRSRSRSHSPPAHPETSRRRERYASSRSNLSVDIDTDEAEQNVEPIQVISPHYIDRTASLSKKSSQPQSAARSRQQSDQNQTDYQRSSDTLLQRSPQSRHDDSEQIYVFHPARSHGPQVEPKSQVHPPTTLSSTNASPSSGFLRVEMKLMDETGPARVHKLRVHRSFDDHARTVPEDHTSLHGLTTQDFLNANSLGRSMSSNSMTVNAPSIPSSTLPNSPSPRSTSSPTRPFSSSSINSMIPDDTSYENGSINAPPMVSYSPDPFAPQLRPSKHQTVKELRNSIMSQQAQLQSLMHDQENRQREELQQPQQPKQVSLPMQSPTQPVSASTLPNPVASQSPQTQPPRTTSPDHLTIHSNTHALRSPSPNSPQIAATPAPTPMPPSIAHELHHTPIPLRAEIIHVSPPTPPPPPPPPVIEFPKTIHDPNSLDYDFDLPDPPGSWPTSPIVSRRATMKASELKKLAEAKASASSDLPPSATNMDSQPKPETQPVTLLPIGDTQSVHIGEGDLVVPKDIPQSLASVNKQANSKPRSKRATLTKLTEASQPVPANHSSNDAVKSTTLTAPFAQPTSKPAESDLSDRHVSTASDTTDAVLDQEREQELRRARHAERSNKIPAERTRHHLTFNGTAATGYGANGQSQASPSSMSSEAYAAYVAQWHQFLAMQAAAATSQQPQRPPISAGAYNGFLVAPQQHGSHASVTSAPAQQADYQRAYAAYMANYVAYPARHASTPTNGNHAQTARVASPLAIPFPSSQFPYQFVHQQHSHLTHPSIPVPNPAVVAANQRREERHRRKREAQKAGMNGATATTSLPVVPQSSASSQLAPPESDAYVQQLIRDIARMKELSASMKAQAAAVGTVSMQPQPPPQKPARPSSSSHHHPSTTSRAHRQQQQQTAQHVSSHQHEYYEALRQIKAARDAVVDPFSKHRRPHHRSKHSYMAATDSSAARRHPQSMSPTRPPPPPSFEPQPQYTSQERRLMGLPDPISQPRTSQLQGLAPPMPPPPKPHGPATGQASTSTPTSSTHPTTAATVPSSSSHPGVHSSSRARAKQLNRQHSFASRASLHTSEEEEWSDEDEEEDEDQEETEADKDEDDEEESEDSTTAEKDRED